MNTKQDNADFSVLIRATITSTSSKIHQKYLEALYEKIEPLSKKELENLDDKAKYISVGPYYENDIPVILNMFSMQLTSGNKIAIKMFKTENLIIVEVK